MRRPPRDAALSTRRVGRRALVLGALQLGVAGVLGARMHRLQVDEADQYRLLAEENRINMRLLPPRAARSSTGTAGSSPATARTTASSSCARSRATWTRCSPA